ncbi:MAG: hypothetical protein HYU57_07380 [Micavibrio aeruginosavorus]|nr:hypothetical protein [Micavibrio aeruginosavorus]
MPNFRMLSDVLFQTDSDGKTSFFPWGKLGKGYIVPSSEVYKELREFWVKVNAISFTIGTPLIFMGLQYCIPYILFVSTVSFFLYRQKVKGLTVSNQKYKSREAFKRTAHKLSFPFLIFGFVFCIIFSLAGLIVVLNNPWLGLIITILFFYLSTSCFRMILVKIYDQKE